jgi:large subunit ribosomal protein L31e
MYLDNTLKDVTGADQKSNCKVMHMSEKIEKEEEKKQSNQEVTVEKSSEASKTEEKVVKEETTESTEESEKIKETKKEVSREDELRSRLKDHFRGIVDETKINIKEERLYNVPLRVAYNVPRTIRAERAVRALIQFIKRHTKAKYVYVSEQVNQILWNGSMSKPPKHVRVLVVMTEEDGEKISRVLPAE